MTEAFIYDAGGTECRGAIALPAGDKPAPGIAIFGDISGIAIIPGSGPTASRSS